MRGPLSWRTVAAVFVFAAVAAAGRALWRAWGLW